MRWRTACDLARCFNIQPVTGAVKRALRTSRAQVLSSIARLVGDQIRRPGLLSIRSGVCRFRPANSAACFNSQRPLGPFFFRRGTRASVSRLLAVLG